MRQLGPLLLTILICSLSSTAFTACGDDEREPVNGGDGDADGDADADADADVGYYTQGNKIMTPGGQVAVFRGINWFGFEDSWMAPHGLHVRSLDSHLDQMVQLGFNLVRLPFSNEMLWAPQPANYNMATHNPDLAAMTPFQVFEETIRRMGLRGMKVILDRHRPSSAGQTDLWYDGSYTEEVWINDWVFLAEHFKGNATVIGADLHNEPDGDATWGWNRVETDWDLAAERCGNAVLAANSDWLIIVEGTAANAAGIAGHYWAGGNLKGVTPAPVELNVPNKLVYSTHDYGPEIYAAQSWFADPSFPNNLPAVFDEYWGYIAKNEIAPILVGEFGIKDTTNTKAVQWIEGLISYMKTNGIYWTYWTWSPDSSDTGGILANDWNTVQQGKMDLLNTL